MNIQQSNNNVTLAMMPRPHYSVVSCTVLRKTIASAKIVKKFNANLYLLGFPHFITAKECRKVP